MYFDTATHSYKTLTTQPLEIDVEKGSGDANGNVNVNYSDNDIHDIMLGESSRQNVRNTFFQTPVYLGVIVAMVLAFAISCIVFRKRAMALNDVIAMKSKKANKVAVKRLRKAHKYMLEGKDEAFYDEVLRALWGYVSDKLSMPVEQLSRDNIADKLVQRGTVRPVIESFITAIDECEYARYAPGDKVGNMQNTYKVATEAITNIDNS